VCHSLIFSPYWVCQLSSFSCSCYFGHIKSLSYISHHFSSYYIHLSSDLTKVTGLFITVVTCFIFYCFLFSFGLWVGPCTPTREGCSICACRYGSFRVVDRTPGLLGNLSPLDSTLGTTTSVVVPTTVPDAGLVCILWSCSAVVISFISVASHLLVVVSSHVVSSPQTLQCTRPGRRSGPVLYSLSRSSNLIPNPNPALFCVLYYEAHRI